MADISMCKDEKCFNYTRCYRAQAEPNPYWQSYFVNSPKSMDGCQFYWPMEETNENCVRHRNKSSSRPDTLGSDEGH